jgi:hypothetical protein
MNQQVGAGATLTFPCAGGVATATFGTQPFSGTVTGTSVVLSNTADFTLETCGLQSQQTITGDLATGQLVYQYGETLVNGDCFGFSTCQASGQLATN